eukprot:TRINITY_DN40556_c0_g1_i1.p1 TRINITY_DN40556_c0_g1~~TRINITY_DN40556_c0_g1_i1.p1  ORF type:complete len:442 (+),score=74.80 TRINITY_DN40556_c0_g1_i1:135-1460(+)
MVAPSSQDELTVNPKEVNESLASLTQDMRELQRYVLSSQVYHKQVNMELHSLRDMVCRLMNEKLYRPRSQLTQTTQASGSTTPVVSPLPSPASPSDTEAALQLRLPFMMPELPVPPSAPPQLKLPSSPSWPVTAPPGRPVMTPASWGNKSGMAMPSKPSPNRPVPQSPFSTKSPHFGNFLMRAENSTRPASPTETTSTKSVEEPNCIEGPPTVASLLAPVPSAEGPSGTTAASTSAPSQKDPATVFLELVKEGYEDEALNMLGTTPSQRLMAARDGDGRSILQIAAFSGQQSLCTALLNDPSYEHINDTDSQGRTALHLAAMEGHHEVCTALLASRRFTAMNAQDFVDTQTALHYAAKRGHVKVCNVLLGSERFDAINASDHDKWTCLHCASAFSHRAVVQLIVSHPRFNQLDAKDAQGNTALEMSKDESIRRAFRLAMRY